MTKSWAFGLSAIAGLILLAIQYALLPQTGDPNNGIPDVIQKIPFGPTAFRLILSAILISVCMAIIGFCESQIERRAQVKYKSIRDNFYRIFSQYQDDLQNTNQRKTVTYHNDRIRNLLNFVGNLCERYLRGETFQISIMVPDDDVDAHEILRIGHGCTTEGGHMVPQAMNRKFKKGEGYCGAAWATMSAQTGNGKRRFVILKDPRYQIDRAPGHQDRKKSYFCLPIPAAQAYERDIMGVLSIDSSDQSDFPRGRDYESFLKKLFVPILSVLEYHLVELEKKRRAND